MGQRLLFRDFSHSGSRASSRRIMYSMICMSICISRHVSSFSIIFHHQFCWFKPHFRHLQPFRRFLHPRPGTPTDHRWGQTDHWYRWQRCVHGGRSRRPGAAEEIRWRNGETGYWWQICINLGDLLRYTWGDFKDDWRRTCCYTLETFETRGDGIHHHKRRYGKRYRQRLNRIENNWKGEFAP